VQLLEGVRPGSNLLLRLKMESSAGKQASALASSAPIWLAVLALREKIGICNAALEKTYVLRRIRLSNRHVRSGVM
jgi:hypothetical protein